MAITTYAELQTSVLNWLHRAQLQAQDSTSIVPDLITVGEKRIFREVRHRLMEASLSSVISGGVIPVPSDYVALRNAYVDGTPICSLQRRKVEYIYINFPQRSSDAMPTFIAREAGSFIFGPFPDSTYTIKGTYYRRLANIAASVNALFTEAPDLYLFAALSEARSFVEDDSAMVALWEAKYQNIKLLVNSEEDEEDFSGSAPTMKSDVYIMDRVRRR